MTAFLVEKGASGPDVRGAVAQAGQCAIVTTEVFLDEVFVPDDQRLGDEGQGFDGLTRTFDISRITLAASAIGLARACLELATAYAGERDASRRADHRACQAAQLAEASRIEASRLLTWRRRSCSTPATTRPTRLGDGQAARRRDRDVLQLGGGSRRWAATATRTSSWPRSGCATRSSQRSSSASSRSSRRSTCSA